MKGPQEYEVESVTTARVHGKRGKKITWRYHVKWKGYDWGESTWEPADSFQGGSEHILESFWQRVDTGGRDISDPAAFKKGEELFVSGPPGRKSLKRKTSSAKTGAAPAFEDSPPTNGVALSAPPLGSRKRQRVQTTVDNEWGYWKPTGSSKVSAKAPKPKRRRVSSPGQRKSKSIPKRQLSASDSQLDADGETDPDVVEVEDELMQVSAEDAEEDAAGSRRLSTGSRAANKSKRIAFDDLEHFYTGNPIDIDQSTVQPPAARKPEPQASPPPVVISSDDAVRDTKTASPSPSDPDPLFDSPPHPSGKALEDAVPHHRARAANPLIKLMDTSSLQATSKQTRITAKARLMAIRTAGAASASTSGMSRGTAKRSGRPGPSRSSLSIKNRSSLLTVTKGTLKSVKGKYTRTTTDRDETDEIEEPPAAGGTNEANKLDVASWSDEEAASQMTSNPQPGPLSGEELLKLAGDQAGLETLPDYEDDPSAEPHVAKQPQGSDLTPAPVGEELPNQPLMEGAKREPDDQVMDTSTSDPIVAEQTPGSGEDQLTISADAPLADEVKKNIELAKEQLFPSASTTFSSFSSTQSSFRSTIFGPLYQGFTVEQAPADKNESSTTFRVILSDGVELLLVLKDCSELKARISDILIGKSSGGKVALFYSADDALAIVNTLKGGGTARIALDSSATTTQQEHFSTFLQRFGASQTLVAPVGKEVCVLYSSENAGIADRLGAPTHLRGLSETLLISHAYIENQLAYVAAIMQASPA